MIAPNLLELRWLTISQPYKRQQSTKIAPNLLEVRWLTICDRAHQNEADVAKIEIEFATDLGRGRLELSNDTSFMFLGSSVPKIWPIN